MKKLFLVSSFADSYQQFPIFVGQDVKNQSVAFIDTASHTEERTSYVDKAETAWLDLGLKVTRISLYDPTTKDVIQAADYIYVAGGNTFYLMQELQKSGVDVLIKEHINAGKIYIGESAGSIIMSPNIEYIKEMDDITLGDELLDYTGFNFISESPLPHVGNKYLNDAVESIMELYKDSHILHPFTDQEVFIINE